MEPDLENWWRTHSEKGPNDPPKPYYQASAGGERDTLEQVATGVARDGVAVWPGMYADRGYLERSLRLSRKLEQEWMGSVGQDDNGRTTLLEQLGESGARHVKYRRYPERKRSYFRGETARSPSPLPVHTLCLDARLLEVAARAFGCRAEVDYILSEVVLPHRWSSTHWHLDEITDNLKAMVLLSEVCTGDAPLRYKVGTHRKPADFNPIYASVLRHGLEYGTLPPMVVDRVPGQELLCTGKPGDVVFFDPRGAHSGTPCDAGARRTLLVNLTIHSPLNRAIHHLRKM